ncbi:MAG: DNA repair protein [Chloroflexi bacterium]|nr:DNA repair protein [Chloroflexota bacterium]
MQNDSKAGHRKRIKERFLAGVESALTDEALLELLLSYAIPQKDLQPLVKSLMAGFGSLSCVLKADVKALAAVNGLGEHSAVLLKLVDWIRTHRVSSEDEKDITLTRLEPKTMQSTLFELVQEEVKESEIPGEMEDFPVVGEDVPDPATTRFEPKRVRPRRGTGLFGKAILKEAIELLPTLPDAESLDEIRPFIRSNLHFSAEQTRKRNADYIVRRMFPDGYADNTLREFARRFDGRQELQDVCYYRFCKAEPVMYQITDELLLPAIGYGRLERNYLRDYLVRHFQTGKSIIEYGKAIVEALAAGGLVRPEKQFVAFRYRDILIPSFAFVLHSEFPEPGMYDIDKLENNEAVRAMLWNPDRILPSLYELRNQGIISKVSEIDSFRQFSTRYNLDQVVEQLTSGGGQT